MAHRPLVKCLTSFWTRDKKSTPAKNEHQAFMNRPYPSKNKVSKTSSSSKRYRTFHKRLTSILLYDRNKEDSITTMDTLYEDRESLFLAIKVSQSQETG